MRIPFLWGWANDKKSQPGQKRTKKLAPASNRLKWFLIILISQIVVFFIYWKYGPIYNQFLSALIITLIFVYLGIAYFILLM